MIRIIAHRGASRRHPENTLAAFFQALAVGVHGLEADVRLTRDGIPVLFHDEDLRRMARRPERIDGLSLAAIRALPLATRQGESFSIPTLEALLELCHAYEKARGMPLLLILDLKRTKGRRFPQSKRIGPSPSPANPLLLVEAVLSVLERHPFQGEVILSSTAPAMLTHGKVLAPSVKTALITKAPPWTLRRLQRRGALADLDYLHPKIRTLTRSWVSGYQRLGLPLHLWTVNRPALLRHLKRCPPVRGILTDDPKAARKVLEG